MNTVFKIMVFSIMLNISIGILTEAIPNVFKDDPSTRRNLEYDTGDTDVFTGELEDKVNPRGEMEDSDNFIYGILDVLNLGIIHRFLKTVTTYLYGLVNLLRLIIGPMIIGENPGLYTMLFGKGAGAGMGVLYIMMTIGYIFGAIYLWTGKKLND